MRVGLAVAMIVAACGDDGTTVVPDGAIDARGADAGPTDAFVHPMPANAELPSLLPCATGWREVDAGGIAACDPWPESGHAECEPFEMHLPGTPGCVPVGAPCPAGDWATDLPAIGVLYVRAGEPPGGDGSRTAPFATVGEALLVATDGATIALAKGTYPEAAVVTGIAVHLRGACAAETVVTGQSGRILAPVELRSVPEASVRDLRFAPGSSSMASLLALDSNVSVSGVVIEAHAAADGLSIDGGSMTIERSLLLGGSGSGGTASVHATGDAIVVARELALWSDHEGWIAVNVTGASVALEDAAFHHAAIRPSDIEWLLEASSGGSLSIARASLTGSAPLSALVSYEATTVSITDSLFVGDGTAAPATSGVFVFDGARLVLDRVRLERASAGAILAGDPTTRAELTDVVVRDVYGTTGRDAFGRAIDVEMGAHASLTRVLVERANEIAVLFASAGTTGTVEHLTVRDTAPDPSGFSGRALQAQLGAVVTAGPLRSTRQHEIAVLGASPGTTLTLTDLVVEDTLERACAGTTCAGFGAGIGVGSYAEARVSVQRFAIRQGALAGVQVARDGELDLCDGEISGNPIGANVQVAGYDVARLGKRVSYHDNGQSLDATTLPVPDP